MEEAGILPVLSLACMFVYKRKRDSYVAILQFLEVQDQNRLLESQTLSLQQRLNNLLVGTSFYSGFCVWFCSFVVLVSHFP